MKHLAILGSTRGSHLAPLLEAIHKGQLSAQIDVVLSNTPEAGILDKARQQGLNAVALPANGRDRESYDRAVHDILKQYPIDVIVMMGYMRIVSPWFVDQWRGRMINVHPSLLPKHAGLMDLQVHQSVLDSGDLESGCSVHYVTEEVDAGAVLIQKKCAVEQGDTAESLKRKVQALESLALIEAIQSVF